MGKVHAGQLRYMELAKREEVLLFMGEEYIVHTDRTDVHWSYKKMTGEEFREFFKQNFCDISLEGEYTPEEWSNYWDEIYNAEKGRYSTGEICFDVYDDKEDWEYDSVFDCPNYKGY